MGRASNLKKQLKAALGAAGYRDEKLGRKRLRTAQVHAHNQEFFLAEQRRVNSAVIGEGLNALERHEAVDTEGDLAMARVEYETRNIPAVDTPGSVVFVRDEDGTFKVAGKAADVATALEQAEEIAKQAVAKKPRAKKEAREVGIEMHQQIEQVLTGAEPAEQPKKPRAKKPTAAQAVVIDTEPAITADKVVRRSRKKAEVAT